MFTSFLAVIWLITYYSFPWAEVSAEVALCVYFFMVMLYATAVVITWKKNKPALSFLVTQVITVVTLMFALYPLNLPKLFSIVAQGVLIILLGFSMAIHKKYSRSHRNDKTDNNID